MSKVAFRRSLAELQAQFESHERAGDFFDLLLSIEVGFLRTSVADGVNEAAADVTIAGMTADDRIVSVLVLATKAAIATMALRADGDFVPGAGKMVSTANKANNTNNQYLITWVDRTP